MQGFWVAVIVSPSPCHVECFQFVCRWLLSVITDVVTCFGSSSQQISHSQY